MAEVAHKVGISETILLVDDDDAIRRLTRMMLKQLGYTVLDVRDAGEASLVCQESSDPISLLLTDLVLPEINGRTLAERLLTVRPEMKVLYMSGYGEIAIGIDAVLEPEANYLQKPFTAETLSRAVRAALRCG